MHCFQGLNIKIQLSHSQIGLDWVVDKRVKTKTNHFASNPVKVITVMRSNLFQSYNIDIPTVQVCINRFESC